MFPINVIIPTYNRKETLGKTLNSLKYQTMPFEQFEVIIVDDGSTEPSDEVIQETYPFHLRYIRQENQGDAAARNLGAQISQAEILIFIDDDILVEPDYLDWMYQALRDKEKRIVMGITHLCTVNKYGGQGSQGDRSKLSQGEYPHFVELCSNNMSLRREDYIAIGMMEGLGFPGSDIWCDVDFAYRAFMQGYEFYRTPQAVAYHLDYVMENLESLSQRMEKVGYRAAALFRKHPGLLPYLDMFRDKTPIQWGVDSSGLVIRKLARRLASTGVSLGILKAMSRLMERFRLFPRAVQPIRRWIAGGYLNRGYRQGLQEFGSMPSMKDFYR